MFEINPDHKVTIDKAGDRTVVIIDDFYKNPDEVRDLALASKSERRPNLIQGLPGSRVYLENQRQELLKNIKPIFDKYCLSNIWSMVTDRRPYEEKWSQIGFMSNIMDDESVLQEPWLCIPHQDFYKTTPLGSGALSQFGVVVYLNTPDECSGGTNLYSYEGMQSLPYAVTDFVPPPSHYDPSKLNTCGDVYKFIREWLYAEKEWKVEYEIEMVYNRCAFYEADNLHSYNIELGKFKDYKRVNQVFFM